MPDGGSAGDTNDVSHGFIIGIACPDTNHDIGRITDGEVVLEVICGTGLGSHLTLVSRVPIPEGEGMVILKLWKAGRLIFQDGGHKVGNLGADDLNATWMSRIKVIEMMTIIIPNIQDILGGDTYSPVGKDLVGIDHLDQRNSGRAKGERNILVTFQAECADTKAL